MKQYSTLNKDELLALHDALTKEYGEYAKANFSLNMARGTPCVDQLKLSEALLDSIGGLDAYITEDKVNCCSYGAFDGIKEAKVLMAQMMATTAEHVIVGGNSSLNLIYDTMVRGKVHGVLGAPAWDKSTTPVKFVCPVPGYDRHFGIIDYLGIEMIPVELKNDDLDMDVIEDLIANDAGIKGLICVPKYSNPTGVTFSDDTVRRLATMKTAAPDFRLYWDNAYGSHHLYDDQEDQLLDIMDECEKAGNPNLVYVFGSTSKISFPGAGISAMAASLENIADLKKQLSIQTIGYDKTNMMRHVRFFKDNAGIVAHMKKHADILRPKFELVDHILTTQLSGLGIGTWTKPNGGYFVSFDALPGCAKAIVAKAKEAGMIMTGAGATYPHGNDPKDNNIRIAPTFPSLEDLERALSLFCVCVKLISVEKLLEAK